MGLGLLRWIAGLLAGAVACCACVTASGEPRAEPAARQVLIMLRMGPQHFRSGSGYGGSYGDGEGRGARWRIAQRLARREGASLIDEWPMPALGVDCYVVVAPPDRSPDDLAARLSREPEVSWSEPVHVYHAEAGPRAATHNDPLYPFQPAAREWRLAELHRFATGRGVKVAVIDSMVDASHVDLAGQVETTQNFVANRTAAPEAHGTEVAGVIAAKADNGVGIAGVAPQSRILGLRACWQAPEDGAAAETLCDSLSLAKALDYAIDHKAQVVNLSLSGPDDQLLGRLIDVALRDEMVVVAAYDPAAPSGGFPASHSGVVAVAAEEATPTGGKALQAPGRSVPTTEPGGRWGMVNGSSFAAAHVSGLLALMRQHDPHARGASAIVVDRKTASVDACATLLQTLNPCTCRCSPPHETLATANGRRPSE